ncbi:hypothetical protein GW17_00060340 [Ensete ventricosum]|nr:hypothetical protein GW17_00060340 [Ensete ventricosum]
MRKSHPVTRATILYVVSLLCCAGAIALYLSFPRSVKPTVVFLPSTSPAHDSVATASVAAGVDFYTALPLHMVGKFISFLSISGRSPVSLTVDVLLLSTAASLPNCRSSSSSPPLRNRRCPLHCRRSYLSAPVTSRRWTLPPPPPLPLHRAAFFFFLHQQPVSIAATINAAHFSVGSVICRPRHLIPLPHPAVAAALICPYSPGNRSSRGPLPLPTALLPASSLLSILRARSARPRFSCDQLSAIARSDCFPSVPSLPPRRRARVAVAISSAESSSIGLLCFFFPLPQPCFCRNRRCRWL